AADDPALHCLSLSDGKRLWKADMNDDLYLAGVFGNAVLLVGKKHCRALRLSDGESLWRVETGVPSGQGIALGQVYYLLPLAAETTTGKPGISVLSIKSGQVLAYRAGPETIDKRIMPPGNLLFWEDGLLSRTLTDLAFYPHLDFKPGPRDLSLTPQDAQRLWAQLETATEAELATVIWTLNADAKTAVTLFRQQ